MMIMRSHSVAAESMSCVAGVPGRGVRAGRKHQLARDYGGDSVQVVIGDGLESFELHVAPL